MHLCRNHSGIAGAWVRFPSTTATQRNVMDEKTINEKIHFKKRIILNYKLNLQDMYFRTHNVFFIISL